MDISYRGYIERASSLDVGSQPGTAIFYSGEGNMQRAVVFANETGRTTLEMTKGGQWLDQEKLFTWMPPDMAVKIWNAASQRYASLASGEVNAFTHGALPDRIFMSVERPTLLNNPDVTRITYRYDPWMSSEYLGTSDIRPSLGFRR